MISHKRDEILENEPELPNDDLQIEPDALSSDVFEIVVDLLPCAFAGDPVDLCEPGQPWLDEPALTRVSCVFFTL